jgi:CRISPR system Cascade subunit CasE
MIQMHLNLVELLRPLEGKTAPRHPLDVGYLVHAGITRLFGDLVPKPFAVVEERGSRLTVLAYSPRTVEELRHGALLKESRLLDWASFASKPLGATGKGLRVKYEVRFCPTKRLTRRSETGLIPSREEDFYCTECDRSPAETPNREVAYLRWLTRELEGAKVLTGRMTRYCQTRATRLTASRKAGVFNMPDCTFQGELEVIDPELFRTKLARGLGRHRSFGFGMLLLKPAH